jgi:hypothetical protein
LARNRGSKRKQSQAALLPEWRKNYVIGVDDCICIAKQTGKRLTARQVANAVEVEGARDWVNRKFDDGNTICFLTTRGERLRASTEEWLEQHGFKYHSLIMGKPVAEQYHYIDDRHVQATTFRGKFAPFVKKEHTIQVFS